MSPESSELAWDVKEEDDELDDQNQLSPLTRKHVMVAC